MSVNDLVSDVIERQLKRSDAHSLSGVHTFGATGSQIQPPGPSESPTIQSILKDSQRNYSVSAIGRSSTTASTVGSTSTASARPLISHGLPADIKQQVILVDPVIVRFLIALF